MAHYMQNLTSLATEYLLLCMQVVPHAKKENAFENFCVHTSRLCFISRIQHFAECHVNIYL